MSGPVTREAHESGSDAAITAACFPAPALLLRTNDPVAQRTVRAFAGQQAEAARFLARSLAAALRSAPDMRARVAVFIAAFEATENWRYRAAASSPHSTGRYSPIWADRFRTPITDDNPNLFRIGDHTRFRDGATWDPATRTYQGGTDTPASRTMRRFEALAAARFPPSPRVDVVCNSVSLPDGCSADGTRLLRGAAAHQAAAEMTARISVRGGDTSRITTSGHLIYTASAPEAERHAVFHHAMTLLARDHTTPADVLTAWLQAAYLLYQAPRRKRGADATIRTFLVAAGTLLLSRPPVLPHDIDLRAYAQTHDLFTTELRAAQGIDTTSVGWWI
ncbi:hypothetical protein [Streptomyces sp. ML-6]|uniref:hypothetical protein n=1 Tax=Streptomyces sp. ML-6 TaxID=2982693 RepID=UPI0024C01703|nr:hypothetical protein [Streptomyces sp. ML-6]MDK0521302.1 hypothetical protein [Streptomyces sp. ML-6]